MQVGVTLRMQWLNCNAIRLLLFSFAKSRYVATILVQPNSFDHSVFNFLRSLFITHDWSQSSEPDIRSCSVCGRREELHADDWGGVWHVTWMGYPKTHLKKHGAFLAYRADSFSENSVPSSSEIALLPGHDLPNR